jgi:hypothetical protein
MLAQGKSWGSSMLDMATRKELAALVYERVETEGEQDLILLPDDGEDHFGPRYRGIKRYCFALARSSLVWKKHVIFHISSRACREGLRTRKLGVAHKRNRQRLLANVILHRTQSLHLLR